MLIDQPVAAARSHSLWATSGRPPAAAGKPKRLPFPLARVSRTDGQRAYVALGAIGRAGGSVQLVLAGRAVAWTSSATEEASRSTGSPQRGVRQRRDSQSGSQHRKIDRTIPQTGVFASHPVVMRAPTVASE